MPGKLPKYAHWVAERRFVVDANRLPPLDPSAARTIEDLYIDGGRLRLRRVTHAATGEQEFKLGKKYAPDDPLIGPMTNLYLDAGEFAALERLPGSRVAKQRHKVGGFVIDIFQPPFDGLVTAECEASNRMAALRFAVPEWTVREVTDDVAYTGWSLAQAQAPPDGRRA